MRYDEFMKFMKESYNAKTDSFNFDEYQILKEDLLSRIDAQNKSVPEVVAEVVVSEMDDVIVVDGTMDFDQLTELYHYYLEREMKKTFSKHVRDLLRPEPCDLFLTSISENLGYVSDCGDNTLSYLVLNMIESLFDDEPKSKELVTDFNNLVIYMYRRDLK